MSLLTFLAELEFDVGLELGTEELDEGLLGGFVALGTKILVGCSLSISSIISLSKTDLDISSWHFYDHKFTLHQKSHLLTQQCY